MTRLCERSDLEKMAFLSNPIGSLEKRPKIELVALRSALSRQTAAKQIKVDNNSIIIISRHCCPVQLVSGENDCQLNLGHLRAGSGGLPFVIGRHCATMTSRPTTESLDTL